MQGMKEDLKLAGNDLNLLTTWWTVGYILGQLPSQVMLSYVRPSSKYHLPPEPIRDTDISRLVWLPTMELLWSVFVIGMAGAKNVKTMYALRFFVGLFEASAYPGIMTLLGNWYIPAELGKRSCIFQAYVILQLGATFSNAPAGPRPRRRCSVATCRPHCTPAWTDALDWPPGG